MLDQETTAVLNVINDISDGAFKIIDADDLIAKVDSTEKLTKPALAAIIRKLAEHDLINIKTSTMEMYCIATTPKARLAEEKIIEETVAKSSFPVANTAIGKEKVVTRAVNSNVDIKLLKRAMFRSALAGSFIGGAIITVIAVAAVILLFLIK